MRRAAGIFAASVLVLGAAKPAPPLGTTAAGRDRLASTGGSALPSRDPMAGKGGLTLPGAPRALSVSTSGPVRGLGPRLAARIRRDGEDAPQLFAARGLTRAMIEKAGGTVRAELGPILAGSMSGRAIRELAPS